MLLNEMSRIKYENLQTYIDQIYSLICEYEAVQGSRNDQVIQTLFLSKVPDKPSSEKTSTVVKPSIKLWNISETSRKEKLPIPENLVLNIQTRTKLIGCTNV